MCHCLPVSTGLLWSNSSPKYVSSLQPILRWRPSSYMLRTFPPRFMPQFYFACSTRAARTEYGHTSKLNGWVHWRNDAMYRNGRALVHAYHVNIPIVFAQCPSHFTVLGTQRPRNLKDWNIVTTSSSRVATDYKRMRVRVTSQITRSKLPLTWP